jgi:hypothetical protein
MSTRFQSVILSLARVLTTLTRAGGHIVPKVWAGDASDRDDGVHIYSATRVGCLAPVATETDGAVVSLQVSTRIF